MRLTRRAGTGEAGVEIPRTVLLPRDHGEDRRLRLLHVEHDARRDVAARPAGEERGLVVRDLGRVHERGASDDAAHVHLLQDEASLAERDTADGLAEELGSFRVRFQVLGGRLVDVDGGAASGVEGILHGESLRFP